MKHPLLVAIALSIPLISCNEDPELVRKRGEQEAEIAKLKGELAIMDERLKFMPEDKTADLEEAKRETKKLEEEHERLVGEVAGLEEENRKIQREYEEYKRKYVVR